MKYKHKLNMLEPGIIFCKVIGLLLLMSMILLGFHLEAAGTAVFITACILILILWILLAVEQRQDKELYLEAMEKDTKTGRKHGEL